MRIKSFHLKRGGALPLAVAADASLFAVYAEGGGSTLDVTGPATVLCVPLRGSVQVSGNGTARPVHAGAALVTDHDARTAMVGHANSRWIVLLGARRAWASVLPRVATSEGELLPELHKADHEMRRLVIAAVRTTPTAELEGPLHALVDKLASLQTRLHEAIARCPGRTWANKRQVFLRLQRVRNYINACCDQELDIGALARMASYSPCHFLRTFRMVYQTTPHAYLIDQRLQRAQRLLRSGNLAVTEVAIASGFENRSAFSRLFHARFGITAQESKRRGGAPVLNLDEALA